MKKLASFLTAGALALLIAAPAQAQYPIELGMDGGLVWTSPDVDGMDSTLDVSLPFQYVRVGFFINDHFSIEPALGFDRQDFGDDFTLTQLSLLASGLYHFSPSRTQPQFYLQLAGGLGYVSFSDDVDSESDSQWSLGFGGGVKLPMMNRLAARLGVLYLRHFESDFMPDANQIRGQVGLSFYTR
jgi:opacity protein-like surface antigen